MNPISTDGAPFGITNFDALWWVVIFVAAVIVAAFYLITYALTRPVAGDDDNLIYKRSKRGHRVAAVKQLTDVERRLSAREITPNDAATETHAILTEFLQTKTRTDITGLTFKELAEGGAPDDLLEILSQSYYILYNRIPDNEKLYRTNELLTTAKRVVTQWR